MNTRSIVFLVKNPKRLQRPALDALRAEGLDVLSVRLGGNAFERLDKCQPDVVLIEVSTDIDLIHNLCQVLKSRESTEDAAVIVLCDETEREEEFLRAGARDVLPRVIENERLIARINSQLRLQDRIDELKRFGASSDVGRDKDNLTKLSLWPDLERRIEVEITRATVDHAFSCCLIHLDQFASVSEDRGYMSGDVLLLELARLLRRSLPSTGLAARFSAGQLAVVLPDTAAAQAQAWANQFREKVQEYPFTGIGGEQTITVSLGVVTFPEDQVDRGDALLHVLVKRTELAVAQGGNCIVVSSP